MSERVPEVKGASDDVTWHVSVRLYGYVTLQYPVRACFTWETRLKWWACEHEIPNQIPVMQGMTNLKAEKTCRVVLLFIYFIKRVCATWRITLHLFTRQELSPKLTRKWGEHNPSGTSQSYILQWKHFLSIFTFFFFKYDCGRTSVMGRHI